MGPLAMQLIELNSRSLAQADFRIHLRSVNETARTLHTMKKRSY